MKGQTMNYRECVLDGDSCPVRQSVIATSVTNPERNTGICLSSVGRIVHGLFRNTHPGENKVLMYSRVV